MTLSQKEIDDRVDAVVEAINSGELMRDAARAAGLSPSGLDSFRAQHPEVDVKIKAALKANRRKPGPMKDVPIFDPDRDMPAKGPFADWRKRYIGRVTDMLGQAIADAMLDTTSRVTFVHAPPGGGKDTTVGDVVLYLKCDDTDYTRVAWIMENDNQAVRRIGERLEPYLTDTMTYRQAPPGPTSVKPESSLIEDFGPFAWEKGMEYPDGTPVQRTTWTKHELRFLQSAAAPEADPDLWATGMGAALYGARVDLMIWSDLFTKENQQNPTTREQQFDWVKLTANSRLDATGRLVSIHTRVGADDNQGRLMEHYIGDAQVYDTKQNGPITVTRYVNGVTVVTCKAIWIDDDGQERSFSPERFPLDDQWQLPGGERVPAEELTRDEAQKIGASRVDGLRSIRSKDPVGFETSYQQNPQSDDELVDFTDAVLDRASDPGRTYKQFKPREVRILTVDPARVGGAGWAMLGANLEDEITTVVDWRFYKRLGIEGIKKRLIIEPIMLYEPTYMVFETNHEGGVLHDREIRELIENFGVIVIEHYTNKNRADPEIGVAKMAGDMVASQLRFPTMTTADKARTLQLRQFFKNWDADPQSRRKQHRKKESEPDDVAMAVWPGWIHAKSLMKRYQNRHRNTAERREHIPESVRRRWSRRAQKDPKADLRRTRARTSGYAGVSFDRLFLGETD